MKFLASPLIPMMVDIHIIFISNSSLRCDSENCRSLLARYDAPPAIDAANEVSNSLQVLQSLFK